MPSTDNTDNYVPTPGIIEVPSKVLDSDLSSDAVKLYLAVLDSWRPGSGGASMAGLMERLNWCVLRFTDALRELEARDILRVGFNAGGWTA